MSYREQRNVTDLLRRMGYPRLISLESFRQPNFLLVADILRWFMKRYDSTVDILHDIDTEQQRVNFIRNFVQHMLRKAGLKLNPKRLYQSDGYAVKEITKVIQFFSNATKEANEMKLQAGNQGKDVLTQFYEYQPSLHKIRSTRELSTILTERGVSFYDLITKEITNRTTRDTLLSKPFDLKDYEHIVRKSISTVKAEEVKIQAAIEGGENTVNSLNIKIEKKRQELERSEQRLETMTKVRPAYMDEYEKLQRELEVLYQDYVTRFRILCHLQHQMNEMSRVEELKRNEAKLLKSNSIGLRNGRPRTAVGDEFSGSDIEEDEEDESLLDESLQQNARDFLMSRGGGGASGSKGLVRPQGTAKNGMGLSGSSRRRGELGGGINELVMPNRTRSSRNNLKGAGGMDMYGSALDDDEDESESDMLLLEGDNSDLGSEIDEDADLLMSVRGGGSYPYGNPDHLPRQGSQSQPLKQPSSAAIPLNLRNGNQISESAKLARPSPPAPTGSRNNLAEQLAQHEELENYRASGVPNGTAKVIGGGGIREGYGGGDSITNPLKPEPRYANSPADISTTTSARPSTKHRSKRAPSGAAPSTSSNGDRERPPTRPSSRATKLLDELNDDDF